MIAVALAAFALYSPAFAQGAAIPRRYTCDGANRPPPLSWTAPPRRTRSFAIEVLDPDAPSGTFTHWLAWGISARVRGLAAGARAPDEGRNDAGGVGYVGPCPPSGRHRYVFRLFALDTRLALRADATRAAFERALRGHVLASARLVGTYARH